MRLHLTIPPETSQLRAVRRVLEGWASAHDLPSPSLCLIATELLANAVTASPPGAVIELDVDLADQEVTLAVSDAGPGEFVGADVYAVGPDSMRGRGLHIVNTLSNRLTIERIDGRTVITAHQYRRMLHTDEPGSPATVHRASGDTLRAAADQGPR
jgi:anti-sigma regulatory factor (Ser/Thr protein kinase)